LEKLFRNINEQLWREAKTAAAREGLSIKDMVEHIIMQKLSNGFDLNVDNKQLLNYFHKHQGNSTKIIRGISPALWRTVKAQAALEGSSVKDWVEWAIAVWLQQHGKDGDSKLPAKQAKLSTKILRNVNEQLWRQSKAMAAHEGITMKEWVEGVIRKKLNCTEGVSDSAAFLSEYEDKAKTKIIRNVDEELWREAKACAVQADKSMNEWVEKCIAEYLDKNTLSVKKSKRVEAEL
jgi:predicted HicB family RNase H-like nuclease